MLARFLADVVALAAVVAAEGILVFWALEAMAHG